MQPQEGSSNFTLKQHIIFPADRKAALAAEAAGPQLLRKWEIVRVKQKETHLKRKISKFLLANWVTIVYEP